MSHETMISPDEMAPRHEVHDEEKLAELIDSMDSDGWQGRPLLVIENGSDDYYFGLTGSHRWAAAEATSTDIPVLVVETDDEEIKEKLFEALRNSDTSEALLEINDSAAINLFEQEEDSN